MLSPTALRALAARLEAAGWTNVAASMRGGFLSVSGVDVNGTSRASSAYINRQRTADAVVSDILAHSQPESA